MSANADKRIEWIDSVETYAYERKRDLVCYKEDIKCNKMKRNWKMINFDDVTKENIKEHNPNWPQIPDHSYRILIITGSGSREANSIFNLISHQLNIDKIYLYAKDLYQAKYQLLINEKESTG